MRSPNPIEKDYFLKVTSKAIQDLVLLESDFPETKADDLKDTVLGFVNDRAEPIVGFINLLLRWKDKHNLVSSSSYEDIFVRHVLDSLLLCAVITRLCLGKDEGVMDLGSGAGFPGIISAITRPTIRHLLVEPRMKRYYFLREAALRSNLDNVEIAKSRFQEIPTNTISKFNTITTRATGLREQFFEYISTSASSRDVSLFELTTPEPHPELDQNRESRSFARYVLPIHPQRERCILRWRDIGG